MAKTYHRFFGPQAEALEDLASYQADLKGARDALHKAKASGDSELRQMLWECAIIRYSRVFMSGVRSTIDKDGLLGNLSPIARDVHEQVMAIRSKYIAHSVNWMESTVAVIMLAEVATTSHQEYLGSGAISFRMLPQDSTSRELEDLISEVEGLFSEAVDQVKAAVDEEMRTQPLADLYRIPALTIKVQAGDLPVSKSRPQRRKSSRRA